MLIRNFKQIGNLVVSDYYDTTRYTKRSHLFMCYVCLLRMRPQHTKVSLSSEPMKRRRHRRRMLRNPRECKTCGYVFTKVLGSVGIVFKNKNPEATRDWQFGRQFSLLGFQCEQSELNLADNLCTDANGTAIENTIGIWITSNSPMSPHDIELLRTFIKHSYVRTYVCSARERPFQVMGFCVN